MWLSKTFTDIATHVARASGKPLTFAVSIVIIVVWAVTGPMFGFSDTWQLVINTGTTIVTFLMVFLIQNTQNRDGAAMQAKLDELIRTRAAQNRYIGIERMTEEELEELRKRCEERAKGFMAEKAAFAPPPPGPVGWVTPVPSSRRKMFLKAAEPIVTVLAMSPPARSGGAAPQRTRRPVDLLVYRPARSRWEGARALRRRAIFAA